MKCKIITNDKCSLQVKLKCKIQLAVRYSDKRLNSSVMTQCYILDSILWHHDHDLSASKLHQQIHMAYVYQLIMTFCFWVKSLNGMDRQTNNAMINTPTYGVEPYITNNHKQNTNETNLHYDASDVTSVEEWRGLRQGQSGHLSISCNINLQHNVKMTSQVLLYIVLLSY